MLSKSHFMCKTLSRWSMISSKVNPCEMQNLQNGNFLYLPTILMVRYMEIAIKHMARYMEISMYRAMKHMARYMAISMSLAMKHMAKYMEISMYRAMKYMARRYMEISMRLAMKHIVRYIWKFPCTLR